MATYQQYSADFFLGPIKPGDLLTVIADDPNVAGNVIIEHMATHYRYSQSSATLGTSGLVLSTVTSPVKHGTTHKA